MNPIRSLGRSSAEKGKARIEEAGTQGGHASDLAQSQQAGQCYPKANNCWCFEAPSGPIFWAMPGRVKPSDYVCPVCEGRGRVPGGRLPGRTRLCPECHGTGRTSPIRRAQLLKRVKRRV